MFFTNKCVLFSLEKPRASGRQEELQQEIDEIIYSIRRKKHDLYRQNGIYFLVNKLMLFWLCFL